MPIRINYLKYLVYLIVFNGFSAFSGSYDDFFKAVQRDDASTVKQLLNRGFDVNTVGPAGAPAVLMAVRQSSLKTLAVLVDAPGLQAEVRNEHDESALMLAALAGMLEVCERLIALDADVNKPGWTPLHYAASGGHAAVIRLLLEHYAYVDAESPNQTTPLMMAAMYGNAASMAILLDAGADFTLRNAVGLTALDFAQQGLRKESYDLIAKRLKP
jgi:ankyrin repeat protein